MTVSYVTGAEFNSGASLTATGGTATFAAAPASGDVLIASVKHVIGTGSPAAAINPVEAGWTRIGTQISQGAYALDAWWRIADGTTTSYTFNTAGATVERLVIHIDRFTGNDATTPVQTFEPKNLGAITSVTITDDTNVARAGSMALFVVAQSQVGQELTVTGGGWTRRMNAQTNQNPNVKGQTWTMDTAPTVGSPAAVTYTYGSSITSLASMLIVIQPPSAGLTIGSFSPSSARPGDVVTVSGSGFSATTQVSVAGTWAPWEPVSDTQLKVTVPIAATGKIRVYTAPSTFVDSATNLTVLVVASAVRRPPGWTFWLADTATMTPIGEFTQARGRTLTLTLNRPGSCAFTLLMRDPLAVQVKPLATCVIAIRGDTVRWSGIITTANDGLAPNTIQVQAAGWFELLNHRIIRPTLYAANAGGDPFLVVRSTNYATPGIFSAPGPASGPYSEPGTLREPLVWKDYDAGQVISYIVQLINRKVPSLITMGAVETTQIRSGSYEPYSFKSVGSQVIEYSNLESGFDFTIHPETRVMNVYAKRMTDLRGTVTFGYNAGPENLSSADRTRDGTTVCNWMYVRGDGGASAMAEDNQSQVLLGVVFEEAQTISGVTDANTLLVFAGSEVAVRRFPRETWNIVPLPWSDPLDRVAGKQPVPRLFDDYNVGDKVSFDARGGTVDLSDQDLAIRIFGVTISIDEEGNEKITNIQTSPEA